MKKGVNLVRRKSKIHKLLDETAIEIYGFIKDSESSYSEGWVPATDIKNELELKFSSYPQENKIDNKTGWLFSTFARMLQDKRLVEFKKSGGRSFYRTKQDNA